jgi:hypothetical protein
MDRAQTGRSGWPALLCVLPLVTGCVVPSASPWREPPPAPVAEGPSEPVFCYRTLADVACYFGRDAAVPGQLVAVYPRPTGDPMTPTHWRRRAAGPPPEPPAPAEAP